MNEQSQLLQLSVANLTLAAAAAANVGVAVKSLLIAS